MMMMIRKMGRSLGFKKIVLIRGGEMNDDAVTSVVKQSRKHYTCHLLCRDKLSYVIITIFHPRTHPLFIYFKHIDPRHSTIFQNLFRLHFCNTPFPSKALHISTNFRCVPKHLSYVVSDIIAFTRSPSFSCNAKIALAREHDA